MSDDYFSEMPREEVLKFINGTREVLEEVGTVPGVVIDPINVLKVLAEAIERGIEVDVYLDVYKTSLRKNLARMAPPIPREDTKLSGLGTVL